MPPPNVATRANSIVWGPGIESTQNADEATFVYIQGVDFFGNNCTDDLAPFGMTFGGADIDLTYQQGGLFRADWTPTGRGYVQIIVTLGGADQYVRGFPKNVLLVGPPTPAPTLAPTPAPTPPTLYPPVASNCKAGGKGLEGAQAGFTATFQVQSRDFEDRIITRGGYKFTAQIAGDSRTDTVSITDNANGNYTVAYYSELAVPHTVTIQYEGEDIKGSPFPVPVTPAVPAGAQSTAEGSALAGGHIDDDLRLVVTAKDRFGNNVNRGNANIGFEMWEINSGVRASFQITDNNDGTYLVQVQPTRGGAYQVMISLDAQAVKGSPFFVPIDGPMPTPIPTLPPPPKPNDKANMGLVGYVAIGVASSIALVATGIFCFIRQKVRARHSMASPNGGLYGPLQG